MVNFRILSTVQQLGFSHLSGRAEQEKEKEREERTVTIPMQWDGKASRDGRTLKMVNFSLPLCLFVLYGLAVIEIARDKE